MAAIRRDTAFMERTAVVLDHLEQSGPELAAPGRVAARQIGADMIMAIERVRFQLDRLAELCRGA